MDWGDHHLEMGRRTLVMGILNVTPDSFSDGGRFHDVEAAVSHALRMASDGADIIDVGGESTRPFACPVSAEEEIRRVVPVIEAITKYLSLPVSVDTTKAIVAEKALSAGASMINDISSLTGDAKMAEVAASAGIPVILMHMQGTPQTMQSRPHYSDPVLEIAAYLETVVHHAEKKGISRSKIMTDPGIGFGKTMAHNLLLIKHLEAFQSLNLPLLIGPSRKSFLQKITLGKVGVSSDDERRMTDVATHAAVAAAVLNGAHIVRVHDVAGANTTIKVIDAIQQAGQRELPDRCRPGFYESNYTE
jgi:dihydropteroate synthase